MVLCSYDDKKIEMALPWMKQSVGLSLIKVVRIKPF
jgi:hypothetical protein